MRLFRRKDSDDSGGGEVPPPESYEVRRGPARDAITARLLRASPTRGADMAAALLPAVRFGVRPADPDEVPLGASKLGGPPDLPRGVTWPGGTRFFAQVDLAGVTAVAYEGLDLPDSGLLSFFAHADDDGVDWSASSAVVLYTPAGTPLVRTPSEAEPVPSARLVPIGVWTWPELELTGAEFDAVDAADIWHEEEIAAACAGACATDGRHQLGGHPRVIQRPVENLLFQLDSDDALDLLWGDAGTLYWTGSLDSPTLDFQSA